MAYKKYKDSDLSNLQSGELYTIGGNMEADKQLASALNLGDDYTIASLTDAVSKYKADNNVSNTSGKTVGVETLSKLLKPSTSVTGETTQTNSPTTNNLQSYIDLLSANNSKSYSVSDIASALSEAMNTLGYGSQPAYNSAYQSQIDSLLNQINNYTYDNFANSSEYNALKNRYDSLGKNAMENTLAQVSARTGGLASSYATTAATSAYEDYMNQLVDAAMSAYRNNKSDMYSNMSLLQGLEDSNYQRYANELNQYNNNQSFAYNLLSDVLNREDNINAQNMDAILNAYNLYNSDRNYDYQLQRDSIDDQRYQDETEYNRTQDQLTWDYNNNESDYNRALTVAQLTGDYSGLKAYGMSDSDIAKANSNWIKDNTSKSSTSNSSSKPKLTSSQVENEIKSGNLTESVLNAYSYYHDGETLPISKVASSEVRSKINKALNQERGNDKAFNYINDCVNNGTLTEQQADILCEYYGIE